MNNNDPPARLARLQQECEVVVGPAILTLAACSVLVFLQVFLLPLNVLTDETTPTLNRVNHASEPGSSS